MEPSMYASDEPRCDICGRLQEDSPNVMPYEGDWNPETGNHLLCEKDGEFTFEDALALRGLTREDIKLGE